MKCSQCGGRSSVINSTTRHGCVFRSHKCDKCGHYFYTQEFEVPKQLVTHELTVSRQEYKEKQISREIKEMFKNYKKS